jgi:ferredoxin-NADP reductase
MTLTTSTPQTFQLVCQKIQQETHDVKTFVFSYPKSNNSATFHYLAGQHINFTVNIAGKNRHCCYTLSSSPTTHELVSITIKRIPKGVVSNHFHDHFQVGQVLTINNANGKFHLPETIPQKILLLSAGSGITPMLSMLRLMVQSQCKNQVIFLHSAHGEVDLIARNEIESLAKQHGRCKVVYTLTQTIEPHWEGFEGRITEQMFRGIPQLTNYHVFTCGPKLFRQTAQQIFKALKLPRNQYHFESFGEPKHSGQSSAMAVSEPEKLISSSIDNTPQVNQQKRTTKISIHFKRWNKHYQGNTKESLLEQGESAGLILPYSCRAGLCGSCKAKLITGEVKQQSSSGLSASEQQQGYILLCSCNAITDVELSHE